MIKVDQLVKNYGPHRALNGVSFEVGTGEIVGFLGPNGAGKTTTMKILTCYLPSDSGSAAVAGYDVAKSPLEVRRRIGYLSEGAPLYLEMNTIDFLRFVGNMRGMTGDRLSKQIDSVVGRCGLEKAAGKLLGELSKGYRQRVGLAQALIHEPDILILDEPTTGLDPNQIQEIRTLIKEIGRQKTVILSTHILPEVTATCDRAIIIHEGKVVAEGTPRELMERGTGKLTVVTAVRGPQSEICERMENIAGVSKVTVLDKTEDGIVRLRLSSNDHNPLAEKVFRAVVESGWVMSELVQESKTLEDVFADLTK